MLYAPYRNCISLTRPVFAKEYWDKESPIVEIKPDESILDLLQRVYDSLYIKTIISYCNVGIYFKSGFGIIQYHVEYLPDMKEKVENDKELKYTLACAFISNFFGFEYRADDMYKNLVDIVAEFLTK